MTYDSLGRLRTRAYYDGSEKFGYSAAGLIAYTNQIGMTNFFVYDAAARKTFETNANSELIRYTNSPTGDLLALVDGKGQVTKWNYDQYGRITNKLDQAGTEILRYTYDPDNRLTNRWSTAKGNTKYSYDAVGNLLTINYPLSGTINFAYDALNRMTNMVDGIGPTKYTYSAAGQLLSEDGPFASDTVTSTYSNRLRVALSLQQPTGSWTNGFSYDSVKRLANVTSSAGTFGYLYESGLLTHHPSRITLPNTSYITNVFDADARLIATYLEHSGGGAALDSYIYIYNPANQRTNLTRTDASTVAYQYDSIGQLKIANSSVNTEDRGYTYDAAWNLNYRTNNGSLSTFLVDNKNELTNAFATTDTYDSNGNLTGVGSGKVYVYDDENRLAQWFSYQLGSVAPTNGDLRTDFAYDGLGRLRVRTEYVLSCPTGGGGGGSGESLIGGGAQTDVGGGNNCTWNLTNEVHYVYDGMRVVQERDGSNVPTVAYTRGNDLSVSLEGAGGIGGLLGRTRYFSGSPTSSGLYFSDGNGNVTYLLATNQTMLASYRYDPFGNIISKSGSFADANVYRFSSKEIHVNSGMYYYGFRFYDPNLQRWINRDPIEESGGLNLYGCMGNAPVNLRDPLGLWSCGEWGQILGDAALGAKDEVGRLINSPVNESLGAAWGWIGLLGGGKLTYGHNATQIENHPLNRGDVTLGHFISYQRGMGPNDPAHDQPTCTYGQHEEAHTHQYEVLGDWFLPMYLSMGIYNELTGGDWWYDNYLEAGPNSIPPKVFP